MCLDVIWRAVTCCGVAWRLHWLVVLCSTVQIKKVRGTKLYQNYDSVEKCIMVKKYCGKMARIQAQNDARCDVVLWTCTMYMRWRGILGKMVRAEMWCCKLVHEVVWGAW